MHLRKKLLIWLLLLALVAALLPAGALASGEPEAAEAVEDAASDDEEEPDAPEETPVSETEPSSEEEAPAADAAVSETAESAANEKRVYEFLTVTMGFNTAAACGIMATMWGESRFLPTALGDSGTSYGICQWHDWGDGVGRYTSLKVYCADHGYDYTTLEGQLRFLQNDLENDSYFAHITRMLRNTENSAQGAYDAGFYWCRYYGYGGGSSDAVLSGSALRAGWARDKFWPEYKSYSIAYYTVSFDANGGSACASKSVTYGSVYGTLPASVRSGYTFAGWYTAADGGTRITEASTVSVMADHTLYAHWTALTYAVTFDANGGATGTSGKTVAFGSEYGDLPTPTRTGYRFDGWYTAKDGGTPITSTTVMNTALGHTLYARWTAVETYTVAFNANGGGSAPFPQRKTQGVALTLTNTAPTRAGYVFLGWAESAAASEAEYAPGGVYTRDKAVTLYAVWRLAYDADGDGAVTVRDARAYLGNGSAYEAAAALKTAVGLE